MTIHTKAIVIPYTDNTKRNAKISLLRTYMDAEGIVHDRVVNYWVAPKQGKPISGMPVYLVNNKTGEVLAEYTLMSTDTRSRASAIVMDGWKGNWKETRTPIALLRHVNTTLRSEMLPEPKNIRDLIVGNPTVRGTCYRTLRK